MNWRVQWRASGERPHRGHLQRGCPVAGVCDPGVTGERVHGRVHPRASHERPHRGHLQRRCPVAGVCDPGVTGGRMHRRVHSRVSHERPHRGHLQRGRWHALKLLTRQSKAPRTENGQRPRLTTASPDNTSRPAGWACRWSWSWSRAGHGRSSASACQESAEGAWRNTTSRHHRRSIRRHRGRF